MKILVAVKRVIDPYVKIRVKSDHTGVETQNVKMAMNPFDEIAVEEAIRLKEQGKATEIILVSIGDNTVVDTLRAGLALGADRAIHIETTLTTTPLIIAKAIKHIALQEQCQLILLGKQAIDGDNSQTGPMVAGLLDWPQASFASALQWQENELRVTCEVDGGLATVRLQLPAVVTTDLRLNTPRYASLPNIMKAKAKPLQTIPLTDLGISTQAQTTRQTVTPPPTRKAGVKVQSVAELVDKLRHEAKVIP